MPSIIDEVRLNRSMENKVGVTCSSRGTEYKTIENGLKEPERKISFGRPRRGWNRSYTSNV